MPQAVLVKNAKLHPLSLLDRLTKDYLQEEYIFSQQFGLDILLERMKSLSQSPAGSKPVFTLYPGGDCSFINSHKKLTAPTSPLELLKQDVFDGLLGLSSEEQAQQIIYTEDLARAIKDTDQGSYALCFILHE